MVNKKNRYRLVLKEVELRDGEKSDKTIDFEFENHDDILALIEKVQQKGLFEDKDKTTQFILGLKLFGEVMLEQRDNPLFEGFLPAFGDLMKRLKGK